MSAAIIRPKIANICAVLAVVLLWVSGAASLTHDDVDGDALVFAAHQSQLSLRSTVPQPDMCAACAWNGAGTTCIPNAIAAPVEISYSFDPKVTDFVRIGTKLIPTTTPRGPPSNL